VVVERRDRFTALPWTRTTRKLGDFAQKKIHYPRINVASLACKGILILRSSLHPNMRKKQ
jgi:hypothetical protein